MGRKTFYTERDIEMMIDQGVSSLLVNDDVVLTDLALQKARKAGFALLTDTDVASKQNTPQTNKTASPPSPDSCPKLSKRDLAVKVKGTVIAKMGNTVPEELLDAVIPQVLTQLGIGD